jgi:hypothetical protein
MVFAIFHSLDYFELNQKFEYDAEKYNATVAVLVFAVRF